MLEKNSPELTDKKISTLDFILSAEPPKDGNCFIFAWWALGLNKDEMGFPPGKQEIYELFEKVESVTHADAIFVRDLSEGGDYEHVAILDPQDKSFIIHRMNVGHPITRMSVEEFKHQRDGLRAKYSYDYMKPKGK